MTRTERAAFPRALAKDRHDSRSGLDKRMPKDGAGAHGWGSLDDELDHEAGAYDDEPHLPGGETFSAERTSAANTGATGHSQAPTFSEEERVNAREFRKTALKEGVDLSQIARTSAGVSTSPTQPKAVPVSHDSNRLRDASPTE